MSSHFYLGLKLYFFSKESIRSPIIISEIPFRTFQVYFEIFLIHSLISLYLYDSILYYILRLLDNSETSVLLKYLFERCKTFLDLMYGLRRPEMFLFATFLCFKSSPVTRNLIKSIHFATVFTSFLKIYVCIF